ncbi:MAG: hypothetical protein NT062_32665 [Proteobacteria bacterium]|nr:hypothetical protein [Pseudomonadota bacterium]
MIRRALPGFSCLPVLAMIGACTDEHFLIVSVTSRPAVHDATTLRVSLANEGSMRTDDFQLAGRAFPVTFSVSSPDRMGALDIGAVALDASGLVVGRGGTTSAFADDAATLLLDTTDFVVNTTVADDQFLSSDYESNGNQLGADDAGNWMVAYREACLDPCHMYGRRFDQTGRALDSGAAAGTLGFPLSTTLTSSISTPAVAGDGNVTLAFWDYNDTVKVERGIACRVVDANGNASGTQTSVAIDPTDVVSVAALNNRNVAVVWSSTDGIKSTIVKPDCTTLGSTTSVATEVLVGDNFQRPVVAATADGAVLYAWISAGSVHTRVAITTGQFQTTDTIAIAGTATDNVAFIRAIPFADGFAILARWAPVTIGGPGKIELYRVTKAGQAGAGGPILVTDQSGGEFASVQGFGAAVRTDGTVLVVWHACGVNGDDSGCGVWGRAIKPSGPVGAAFGIPTTTTADQTDPSVVAIGDAFAVAWNDASATEPDRSKLAVRARVVYLDPGTTP